ncbi:MAG: uracil-DNA glycosylase [Clostridiales bacterium]|jgi:uracil-DNA glycosylase|nr:uracil-DNA glycosylase [Clostridiales bacterium]
MPEILKNDWNLQLGSEFEKDYYKALRTQLISEYKDYTIYPDKHDIFNALHYTAYKDVKVVILGQDPYHGPGQAHGLAFSVKKGVPVPRSLINIFKELKSDLGIDPPGNGYLKPWAEQGVLLLNTVLTVRDGDAHSHKKLGWETFTDAVISAVDRKHTPVVFILWGRPAQEKQKLITNPIHKIIKSVHPSPLSASRGFFGSRPFSQANAFLEASGQAPIDWSL